MLATRRAFVSAPRAINAARQFSATSRAFVKVGDAIPGTLASGALANVVGADRMTDVELMESSPGNKVNLSKELAGKPKGLIIGVPAAFSPACSSTHIPGYIKYEGLKDAGDVYVVSVNDAFVYVLQLLRFTSSRGGDMAPIWCSS